MEVQQLGLKITSLNKNENLKQLCLDLVYSGSGKKVIKILDKAGLWNNDKNWKFYEENVNNFATIGNQQILLESNSYDN